MRARRLGWVVMTFFGEGIALYGLAALLVPGIGAPFLTDRRAEMYWAVVAHLGGGALAMALGPWQFCTKLRQRALMVHRWTGRIYVIAVLAGGIGGLVMATVSEYGLVTHVGFGLLGALWLAATIQAWLRIRAGDQVPNLVVAEWIILRRDRQESVA